jgi:hypothetical protein
MTRIEAQYLTFTISCALRSGAIFTVKIALVVDDENSFRERVTSHKLCSCQRGTMSAMSWSPKMASERFHS